MGGGGIRRDILPQNRQRNVATRAGDIVLCSRTLRQRDKRQVNHVLFLFLAQACFSHKRRDRKLARYVFCGMTSHSRVPREPRFKIYSSRAKR